MNWQPIENAPKPAGFVLISNNHHWLKAYWNCAINEWCDEDGEQLFGMKPTHFMLVTPPGEQQPGPTELSKCDNELPRALCGGTYVGDCLDNFESPVERMSEQQPESVNQRLLEVCNDVIKWASGVPEDVLLFMDTDRHPPSWMSVIVERAIAAIDAAKQAKGTAE